MKTQDLRNPNKIAIQKEMTEVEANQRKEDEGK